MSNNNEKIKYQYSYVAFLDILGFKELVEKNTVEKIKKLFDTINKLNQTNSKIALHKDIDGTDSVFYRYNELLSNCSIKIMSDSIVVAVPFKRDYPEGLAVVIDICREIQLLLYDFDTPVFLRGAIAKGPFYINEDTMFGKGLVDAYLAQEKIAIYPRIIISDNVIKSGTVSVDQYSKFGFDGIAEDERDGYKYIDTLTSWLLYPKQKRLVRNEDKYIKISKTINTILADYKEQRIREKYIWLNEHLIIASQNADYFRKVIK